MRVFTGILFCIGAIWAAFAWVLLFGPSGIFMPRYEFTSKDIGLSLLGALLSATGYWIWFGWLSRSWKQYYLSLSPKSFWILVTLNHAGWLLFGYFSGGEWFAHQGGFLGTFRNVWLIGNILVGTFVLVLRIDEGLTKRSTE